MKRIDLNTYARKAHFAYFQSLAYPYLGLTVNVDVTDLAAFCRENRCSFYLTVMHLAALAADEVPEFRQRIRDGGIVEYDECPTSHVELKADGTYCYCTLYHHMPFAEYLSAAEAKRAACLQAGGIEEDENVEQMYFVTSLPWLHYTALIQPVAGGDESNPRISWGRYEKDHAGRLQLPVTVLVHHGLVDGIHVAAFYDRLREQIRQLTEKNSISEGGRTE